MVFAQIMTVAVPSTVVVVARLPGQILRLGGADHASTTADQEMRVTGTGLLELGEGDWDMLTVTNTEEYGGPPFSGSSPDGAGTVTNLFTNPDMQATSGEVVVWENLVPNPSFEHGTDGWAQNQTSLSTTT